MPFHFDLPQIIQTVGYAGLVFIVFAESGLFFGFFLPGDSLLFTAGFLASQGFFNLWVLLPLLMIAAVTGDSVGYWTGKKFGGWLMKQKENFFFQKRYVYSAERFYEKHGGKAILLARFVPAVRTFVPIVAGIARMDYQKFISYNVFGGIFWVALMLLLGYFLGSLIPGVDKYLLPIVFIIIVISVLPGLHHFYSERKNAGNK